MNEHTVGAAGFPLNQHTKQILGTHSIQCCLIAERLRTHAGRVIPRGVETEQAYVIYWLLGLYRVHGPEWKDRALELIKAEPAEGRITPIEHSSGWQDFDKKNEMKGL